ncbi:hypothetical protein D8674_017490 [Pyrus ussuriensis x Pyrus communis]|uniref:Uncharacterized protein n=1 Tax=Pyrus ussuriensis x Pyrus communis TaxID=2448454 RepID=A0A5N5HJZ5_9ROSA|nr:hypothetical protein D8674_017490 [Pyrus ussuriensis x Pyrus communis]
MSHLSNSASDNVVINKKRKFHRVMNDHRRCINSDSMRKMKSEKEVHSILVHDIWSLVENKCPMEWFSWKKESEETKKTNFIIDDTDTIVMNYIDDIFKGVSGR